MRNTTFRSQRTGVAQGDVEVFSEFDSGGSMWTGSGGRERRLNVRFDHPFRAIPAVQVTASLMDMHQDTAHRSELVAENTRGMVDDFHADGVILHSDRSCKPYSLGQMDQRDRLVNEVGVPALLLDADHNDPRSFSEEQATARLEAFFEMMEAA